MISIGSKILRTTYANATTACVAINAAIKEWCDAFSFTPIPTISEIELAGVSRMGALLHLVYRKLIGVPTLHYRSAAGVLSSHSSFEQMAATFESDVINEGSGFLMLSVTEAMRNVGRSADSLLISGLSSIEEKLHSPKPLSRYTVPFYTRSASNPRFGDVPWLTGLFDLPLVTSEVGSDVKFSINVSLVSQRLKAALELTSSALFDGEITPLSLMDIVSFGVATSSKRVFSFQVTKNAYIAASGADVADGTEYSIINQYLSAKVPSSLIFSHIALGGA